jgi:hypothetical protein
MLRRVLSFRARQQPYMVRHSYTHELRSALTFPLAASLAEGSFTGVIAAKNFDADVVLMSVITAAPMFGNIMALIWSDLAMGRRKVPLVNALQVGVVLMVASVALCGLFPAKVHTELFGGVDLNVAGWLFAAQIVVARLLASGIITIRSAIWRANYPREVRGQITGRIATVATAVLAGTTFLGSYLLDLDPRAYTYLYPAAALLGAVGIWQFSKIRVRREALLRRREEQVYVARPEELARTDETNVMNYDPRPSRLRFVHLFRQAFQVLRDDPEFRSYQRWQMLSGFSFMMLGPSLLYMVSKEMTNRKEQYMLATAVVQLVPMVVSLISVQAWAPLFDRVHVSVFRVYQTSVSVSAQALLLTGALVGQFHAEPVGLAIVALAQVFVGVSNGGGNLAWNLGHNDFAPADKAGTYMGVHVMLTGMRGCLAPFFGAWLYQLPGVGRNVFGLSVLMCIVALVGFAGMARRSSGKPGYAHRASVEPPRGPALGR